jgi:multidrug resistance protein, MATE family
LKLTFIVTAVWMSLLGVCYFALPQQILHFFVPAGEGAAQFLGVGVRMLVLSAFWQLFDAAGITIGEALRAAGDTAYAMWTRGVLAWCVFLPGSWICVRHWGGSESTATVWMIIYLGLLALVLFLRFRSGAWRKIELVPEAELID